MKKIISLGIDEDKKQYVIDDNFVKLTLDEMTGTIGILTCILHNYIHIQGDKQNAFVKGNTKRND